MAGLHFEYDERGSTFYYFLVSFYALVLIPATYYLWPRSGKKDTTSSSKTCQCEPCLLKDSFKKSKEPWKQLKQRVLKFVFLLLWIGFAALAYKAAHIEVEHVEWDPYAVLGLDRGASVEEVKKAYRQLTKIHHPDRGGEEKRFVEITKAHLSLTDDESKKNYDMYGNPDGPGAQTFGIALPSWLVSKEYSIWVLAVYGLIFMVIMPTVVGIWWYRSIKFSADSVLMDTTQMFMYMIHKTSLLNVKRVLAILSSAYEFSKQYNKEVIERPSDQVQLSLLLKQFPNVGENKRERPICLPFSVKARLLMFSHLARQPLPPDTLQKDLQLVLKKCPYLIHEMIQVYSQVVMFANAGRVPRMPALDTLDNIMKVSPIIVQATWDSKSPLLQLPHFSEDMLRHCITKKRRVKTCSDLAKLDKEDRRMLLRNLSDPQYVDVMNVLASMPQIEMDVHLEVRDDEDKERITAGALVVVVVKLKRTPLVDGSSLKSLNSSSQKIVSAAASSIAAQIVTVSTDVEKTEDDDDDNGNGNENAEQNETDQQDASANAAQQQVKRNLWEKQKKKKGGGGKKKKKPVAAKQTKKVETVAVAANETPEKEKKEKVKKEKDDNSEDESCDDEQGSSSDDEALKDAVNERVADEDDEDDLQLDEEFMRKEKILETKSKITHLVHCPYFPDDKYEWYWLYLCDRKKRQLVCPAVSVTTLVEEEEVELRFAAQKNPGTYTIQVCLRSDSYLDCDQQKDIKYTVHEAKQITSHPQWEFEESEDKKSEADLSDDASEYTEDDDDDD